MPRRFTLDSYRLALSRDFVRGILKGIQKATQGEAKIFRREVRAEIKRTSIGKALWGRGRKKKGGMSLSMKAIPFRFSQTNDAFIIGSKLKGVASMLVEGGRIKSHAIEPAKASVLAFTSGGADAFATRVDHPGMSIPGNRRLVEKPLDRFADRTGSAMARLIDKTAKKTLGS